MWRPHRGLDRLLEAVQKLPLPAPAPPSGEDEEEYDESKLSNWLRTLLCTKPSEIIDGLGQPSYSKLREIIKELDDADCKNTTLTARITELEGIAESAEPYLRHQTTCQAFRALGRRECTCGFEYGVPDTCTTRTQAEFATYIRKHAT